jgi:ABC-type sulfate/molybdate transport systems ATPase subunit
VLTIDVGIRLGGFTLGADLALPPRGVTVVAGESGAGKTTLLRAVAGLVRPDRGRIALDGATWFDAASGASLPPERRPVGWVPQDFALFPHLSAFENVAFGLRACRTPGGAIARRVGEALERLGVGALAGRRPGTLSGGQQQRVALARALVLEPRVLLLDEPLASLDVATRRRVRGELRQVLESLPCATLLVSHTPSDAFALGERIAVLEAGRITQVGTREELLARPGSDYVAEFLGAAPGRSPG